jgi:hypothetical protein
LTPGALAAHDLPTRQGFMVGDLPRRRGGFIVLGGGEGEWWPAVAPVSFYGTDEGRWSLGMSQLKKKDTWGGAH